MQPATPDPLVNMKLHDLARVLQQLAEGIENLPNLPFALDHELTHTVDAMATVQSSLEILRAIPTDDIANQEEQWFDALDTANDAYTILSKVVNGWWKELAEHEERASTVLNTEDEDEE